MAGRKKRKAAPSGLIQSYGVYWKKSLVRWERKRGGLWGNRNLKRTSKTPSVNFWTQAGVYILYNDAFEPIYSGQTTALGSRLRNHTRNRWLGPKWTYFSWFGLKKLNKKQNGLRKLNARYSATARVTLDTLEAILIAVGARTENRQGPKLHGAVAYHQVVPKAPKS